MMCMYNPEIKTMYLAQFEHQETREVYTRLLKKSFEVEKQYGKDLFDFNEEEFEYYFRNILRLKTKESARSYCNVIANYVQWAIDHKYSGQLINPLKGSQDYFYEFVQETRLYFSYQEKEVIISKLVNKQDSFIIEALWHGIQGNKVSELVNLKMNDMDIENNKVILRNDHGEMVRELEVENDSPLISMARLANLESEYVKLNGTVDYPNNLKETVTLSDSKYVLKSALTKRNGGASGGEAVSHYTVYNRLEMFRTLEEMEEYQDALTSKNIVRSGMIYKALELYKRDGELGTHQIKEICKKYNMKYKWALRDYLNIDMLNELYPSEMKELH
ncbi:phage lytic cycle repressor MrpR family protein [Paenibacillus lactis]|uniref:phage lytic cycle repressor MrpR family protein n=1 Tax=Paenibacillus lactis TaxID=228574 RepID=UPI001B11DACD|nr:hypothetical protein [Paenibacillus lactis]GIO92905.1 hypothetical protein J31TS3_41320 [Paenibacillus lactis]